jgi:hypothetical protein
MPISIPTSIAGISIPGAINGPLAKLFKNEYGIDLLSYPRNLGTDPTRRHTIVFSIEEPAPDTKNNDSGLGTTFTNLGQAFFEIGEAPINALKEGTDPVTAFRNALENTAPKLKQVSDSAKDMVDAIRASDVKRQAKTQIALYIPDTVNVQYNASYSDTSLVSALGTPYFLAQAGVSGYDTFKNIQSSDASGLEKITNAVGNDPNVRKFLAAAIGRFGGGAFGLDTAAVGDLLLRGQGAALNPQLQVLFTGVGFRSFQFDFTFTPYSKEESETVNKIIKAFKMASAPTIETNAVFGQGLFYKVPDKFKIKFMYDGQENTNVHKIAECVLTSVIVNYAPNGWVAFEGGAPVQTTMTLQFQEIEIIDKTRINEDY